MPISAPPRLTILLLAAAVAGCGGVASPGGAGAGAPGAGPVLVRRPVARYDFYDVRGRTAAELGAQMDSLGPVVAMRPALAATFWTVGWTYRIDDDAGRCLAQKVEVQLDARVRMPRWRPPADADPALVADWNAFVHAVSAHEAGHVDLASEAVRRVRSRLRGMSAPTCPILQARMRETGDEIVNEYRRRNRRYDREVRPGTEAERWPPHRPAAALHADTAAAPEGARHAAEPDSLPRRR